MKLWTSLDDALAVRFLEESQSLLALVSAEGRISWANGYWERELGWSANELAGHEIVDLIHGDERRPFSAALMFVAETGEGISTGCRTRTSSGNLVWISWHLSQLDDGMLALAGHSIDEVVRGRVRAVKQSDFLRSVLDAVDASIAIIDAQGVIVATNAQWSQADGVSSCGVGAPVGTDYLALCTRSPDDEIESGVWSEEAPAVAAAVRQVLDREAGDAAAEYSVWRADGQQWYEARVSSLHLSDRRRGCVVAHIDITSRVVAEREAAARTVESELLSLVARHTNNPVVITDAAGRVRWVNEAFTRLTGLDLDEVRGRRPPSMTPSEDHDPVLTDALAVMEAGIASGEGYQVEWAGCSTDGRRYWVEIEARPISNEDGHLEGFIAVQTEITARKRMERQLRDERALLHDIMAAVPFTVFWKDRDSRFQGCNLAMATSAGLDSPDEIVGLSDTDLPWADQAGTYIADDREVMSSGEARLHVQGTLRQADGAVRHILASKVPLRGDDGEVIGLIGVFVDVTEQRELEAQLANANKLESIGQLAAGVAHEINTPTQYVGDNLHFLRQSMEELGPVLAAARELAGAVVEGTATPEQASAFLAGADDADVGYLAEEMPRAIGQSLAGIERVSRIVGAMKEFSHPGVDAMSSIDLNRAIESAITVSTNEWKFVADVVTDLAPDLPLVPGIPGELGQVFVNMVVNGAHAIADVIRDRPGERGCITVTSRRDGDHAEIRFADTGTGIPEEVRDKVFDHFFTTKEVGKGTGQGLSLAHGVVVTKHGGTVTFETESGAGTTFIVRIPLEQPTRPDPA